MELRIVMMQEKVVALYTPVPAAVHMWFADGAGWAYHPDIGDEVLEEIIRTVTPILYSSMSETSVARKCQAGLLVVDKVRQENCADPGAIERSPHTLRVALLSPPVWDACSTQEEPDDKRLCDDIFRQFSKLPTPTKRGQCESLAVWVTAKPARTATVTPEVIDETKAWPQKEEVDDVTRENSHLKREVADLWRENANLRRAVPTRRQRLASALAIVLVTALLTAAALFLSGLISGSP